MFNSKYEVTIDGLNTSTINLKLIMAEPNDFGPVTIGTDGTTVFAIVSKKFLAMGNLEQQARIFSALAAAHQDDIIADVFGVDVETIDREIESAIDDLVEVTGDIDLSFYTPSMVYKAAEVSRIFGKKIAKKILKDDCRRERKLSVKVAKEVGCEPWKSKASKETKVSNKATAKAFKAYAKDARKSAKRKPEVVGVNKTSNPKASTLDAAATAI